MYVGAANMYKIREIMVLSALQHHCIGGTVLVALIVLVQTEGKKRQKCSVVQKYFD